MATTLQKVTLSITPKDAQGNVVDLDQYPLALREINWTVNNPDFVLTPHVGPGQQPIRDPAAGGPVDLAPKDPAVGGTATVTVVAVNSNREVLR